jgi:hypothetical protein
MTYAAIQFNGKRPRRGVALLMVLLTLAFISVLLGAISWQILVNRRVTKFRQHQIQAAWLARAGVELACSRLLTEPVNYTGESVDLMPNSQLRIQVQSEPKSPNSFRVVSEARFPQDARGSVLRSITCRMRRATKDGKVHIEIEAVQEPVRN